MKAWKEQHYNRASAFLSIMAGTSVAAVIPAPVARVTPPAPVSLPPPEPVSPPPPAPTETAPTPVSIEAARKAELVAAGTSSMTHPPMVKVLPSETSPPIPTTDYREPPPAPAETEPVVPPSAPAETEPVKIKPRLSAANRAPAEAGRFFGGIAWAGGEASFEAAAEPDTKPGISISAAPEVQTQRPPDRSNPILAATRSAMVTAEKVATATATAGQNHVIEEATPEAVDASDGETASPESTTAVSPAIPEPATIPSEGNAAGFFKNLNWKNN